MKIIKITSIGRYILSIYYTSNNGYQYSIIDDYGTAYKPDEIYYSVEAAEREGRKVINTVNN